MRIVVISAMALPTPTGGYGGLENQAYHLAHGLVQRGHKVLLVGAKGSRCKGTEVFEAVEPAYRGLEIEEEAYERYKHTVLTWNADGILDHSHFFSGYRLKVEDPNLRVVKTWHDLEPAFSPPPKESYDFMVAVSKFHAEFLEEKWRLPYGSILPIYNGINVASFPFREDREDWLLFFSRIADGKGTLDAIRLAKKYGFKLVVAGEDSIEKGNDPDYVWSCIREADGDQIKYLGRVSEEEKLNLMCRAKAVIVPLKKPYEEVFGIWAVEAMATGSPVLTTDNGAMPELVKHGETGFIAESEELGGYVDKLDEIRPSDCRRWVADKLNIGRMVTDYEELFRRFN